MACWQTQLINDQRKRFKWCQLDVVFSHSVFKVIKKKITKKIETKKSFKHSIEINTHRPIHGSFIQKALHTSGRTSSRSLGGRSLNKCPAASPVCLFLHSLWVNKNSTYQRLHFLFNIQYIFSKCVHPIVHWLVSCLQGQIA